MKTAGDKLFIAGLTDIRDTDAILAKVKELAPGSPVDHAFNNGGRVNINGLKVPVPFLRLQSTQILPVGLRTDDGWVDGLAICLPKYLSRAQHAWEKVQNGTPYRMDIFVEQFYQDLFTEMTSMIRDRILVVKHPGLQGQAAADIRLQSGEVGISRMRANQLQEQMARNESKVGSMDSVDGMMVVGKRFPAASPTGSRWVILRILDDVDDNKIYVNPVAMQYLHGGDFDGDLYYILTKPPFDRLDGLTEIGAPERIAPIHRDRDLISDMVGLWKPTTEEDAVNRVLGACIKELTGLLTYTFLCLARGYAVKTGNFLKAYEEVLTVFEPLMEAVMDARKKEGSVEALFRLADTLQRFAQAYNQEETK